MGHVINKHALILGLTAVLSATSALSGGFSLREQSAESQGASFAGVAAGTEGLSAMYWNPATMIQHSGQGFVSETDVSVIIPQSEADDGGPAPGVLAPLGLNESGNIGVTAFVPSSHWVYAVNDQLVVGAAINAPLGLATDADNWYGSVHGDKSKVVTLNFSPAVAYRLTDSLSLGFGAQIEYMSVKLNSRLPTGVEIFSANGDDVNVGFTAGLLFEPTATTDIGIGFRSSVSHKLKGDGMLVPAAFSGDIAADFSTPELLTIGIRQQLNDQFTLLAGAEWSNWSRFKELSIDLGNTGLAASTTENWKDGWLVSLGGEYAYSDQLTLRAGAAFEKSPVPDATRTPRIPDNDRIWLSAGASYRFNDMMRTDISYSHVFMDKGNIDLAAAGGLPAIYANFDQSIDIVSASLTLDW